MKNNNITNIILTKETNQIVIYFSEFYIQVTNI